LSNLLSLACRFSPQAAKVGAVLTLVDGQTGVDRRVPHRLENSQGSEVPIACCRLAEMCAGWAIDHVYVARGTLPAISRRELVHICETYRHFSDRHTRMFFARNWKL
jgi:hypothetical protein